MSRRLLLVDEVATNRILLKAKLSAAGYDVDLAPDVEGAKNAIRAHIPDVALISSELTDPDSRHLPALLGSRTKVGHIPVIYLDSGNRTVLPSSDIDAVIQLPVSDALLLARLRSVLRIRDLEDELAMRASTCREMGLAEDAAPFNLATKVLIVPKNEKTGRALADRLPPSLRKATEVHSIGALLTRPEQLGDIDVVYLEADHSDPASDLHHLSDLRCRADTRHAAIIFCLPKGADATAAMALDLGASDVILGDANVEFKAASISKQLSRRTKSRQLLAQVTNSLKLAVIDPLTGLYNRRYAINHLERLAKRSSETGRALAVMVLDIDKFKQVNDTFGHQCGDQVICSVAQTLKENLRTADLVSRIGGEEFLVTMADTTVVEASAAAQRLRKMVAELAILAENGSPVSVTMSIGLTVQVPNQGSNSASAKNLIRIADEALFRAKSDGRNQVNLGQEAA